MQVTLLAVLAIAGSIGTSAFASDNQIEVDRGAGICHADKPGAGELKPSGAECRQPKPANLVAERALAQTGLAIGLASTVLQSQLAILEVVVEQSTSCVSLPGGGSVLSNASGTTVTVYYGAECSQPYIVATPQTSTSNGSITVAETAIYYGLTGSNIGTMTLNETAVFNDDGSANLYGLGIFTPVSGAKTPVQLGLYCAIPSPNTALCGGGIAQNFPALDMAIGAVTPLNLSLDLTNSFAPVTFVGGGSTVTGPMGSLTLTNPSAVSLVIHGGAPFTVTTSSGGAAEFSLFPPTPTSWTLDDTEHDQEFSISVVSNTVRNLTFKITQGKRGGTLAIGTIDQSGSGSITYSDGSTAVITNWTLAE